MPTFTSSPAGGEKESYTLTWETESYSPIIRYRLKYRKQRVRSKSYKVQEGLTGSNSFSRVLQGLTGFSRALWVMLGPTGSNRVLQGSWSPRDRTVLVLDSYRES